jgi:hypothetical protein
MIDQSASPAVACYLAGAQGPGLLDDRPLPQQRGTGDSSVRAAYSVPQGQRTRRKQQLRQTSVTIYGPAWGSIHLCCCINAASPVGPPQRRLGG